MTTAIIKPSKLVDRDLTLAFVDIPDEVEQPVREILSTVMCFIPSWLRALEVTYRPGHQDELASVNVEDKYRRATIYIAPAWLELDEVNRRVVILHELVHIWTAPAHRCMEQVVEKFIPDSPSALRRVAKAHVDDAFELVAEDLANRCERILTEGTQNVSIQAK